MKNFLKSVGNLWNERKKEIFTYYLPAPPPRKSGYREREFDQICNKILELGASVDRINMQTDARSNAGGLWVLLEISYPKHLNHLNIEKILNVEEIPFPNEDILIQNDDLEHGH